MTFFKSLMVALSTYSIIPVPQFEWNEKNMKYSMCFFPVVGVVCGALVLLVAKLSLSAFFVSALTACIPLIVSGGIHMDGFMDTIDSLSSHAPRDKKLEILSDPHIGAFAVIYMAVYLVITMAVVYEIHSLGALLPLCPVYILSRSMSALCAVNMLNARKSGMLSAYTKDAKKIVVNITMTVVSIASAVLMIIISLAINVFMEGFLSTFITRPM